MAKKSVNSTDSESTVHPQNSFQAAIEPAKRFGQDSYRLVKRCTKPDAKEFKKIAIATTVGFLVMGFLGFFVKLVHIPSQTNTKTCTHSDTDNDKMCRRVVHAYGLDRWQSIWGQAQTVYMSGQTTRNTHSTPLASFLSPSSRSQQHHRWPVSAHMHSIHRLKYMIDVVESIFNKTQNQSQTLKTTETHKSPHPTHPTPLHFSHCPFAISPKATVKRFLGETQICHLVPTSKQSHQTMHTNTKMFAETKK